MTPQAYPRIPHMVAGRGTRDDVILTEDERAALLRSAVVVEEKLDGANVMIWQEGGHVECATRAGPGGQDRGRQLGPLRAWLAGREQLANVLGNGETLYAEWLWVADAVRYERLPGYLVGVDLRRSDGTFLTVDDRAAWLARAGLPAPPELFRGVLKDVGAAERLIAALGFVDRPMEGIVIRRVDGEPPRVAKLLAPEFVPLDDSAWRRGRERNQLAQEEPSWR